MSIAAASRSESPRTPWWLVLLEGISLIILGFLFISKPGMTSVVAVQIVGLYWLIAGVFKIISIFIDSSQWGWKLFFGVIGIVAGILVIQHPIWSTAIVGNTLLIVVGIMGIAMGLISIIQAFQGAGWGTGILGVLSVLLGFFLLANTWELALSLPWTLGILSIIGGILAIYSAFQLRREQAAEEIVQPASVEAVAPAEEPMAAEVVVAEKVAAAVEEPPAAEQDLPEEPEAAQPLEEPEAQVAPPAPEVDLQDEASALHGNLIDVQGIGPKYAASLNELGIETPGALLEKGATPSGRKEIAEKTGISAKILLTWLNHIDLFRIKGVAAHYAELLEETGVDTVPELAQRNPQNLYAALDKVNHEKQLVRHMPTEGQVESWVSQAKQLPRKIQY